MALTVSSRLGPYQVTAQIGRGGMGEVHLALDTKLERSVALKILPDHLAGDRKRLKRLEREAKAAAALNHPGIVTVYSFEEADGVQFLTMEYIEGEPLSCAMETDGLELDLVTGGWFDRWSRRAAGRRPKVRCHRR